MYRFKMLHCTRCLVAGSLLPTGNEVGQDGVAGTADAGGCRFALWRIMCSTRGSVLEQDIERYVVADTLLAADRHRLVETLFLTEHKLVRH